MNLHGSNDSNRSTHFTHLESLYSQYHSIQFLDSDPIELILKYTEQDRPWVAFMVSAFSLGRVTAIRTFSKSVLGRFGTTVHNTLIKSSEKELRALAQGLVYRFFNETRLGNFFVLMGRMARKWESIESSFMAYLPPQGLNQTEDGLFGPLKRWIKDLRILSAEDIGILLPSHTGKSGLKRILLFMKWMVRSDSIDPGGWTCITPKDLLIPLDTHMLAWSRVLGFTSSKMANQNTCLEVTRRFRELCPDDPLRYDFCLTRTGIISGAQNPKNSL